MEHVIFVFIENYRPSDFELYDDETYAALSWSQAHRISTRKLDAFKESNNFEYGYVQHLIEDALKGSRNLGASRKFSFSDAAEWYEDLAPDEDCTDPLVYVSVELW